MSRMDWLARMPSRLCHRGDGCSAFEPGSKDIVTSTTFILQRCAGFFEGN